jgi:hypothetical protein
MFTLNPAGYLLFATPQTGRFVELVNAVPTTLLRSATQSGPSSLACSIKTDVAAYPGQPVLQCTSPGRPSAFQSFLAVRGSVTSSFLYGTSLATSPGPAYYTVDLGVFTGSQCF